jgi:hypothetical protein
VVPQTPDEHTPEQQSLAAPQASPSERQSMKRHVPVSQMLLQQSLGPLHDAPTGKHMVVPHTPAVHAPEQHWDAF